LSEYMTGFAAGCGIGFTIGLIFMHFKAKALLKAYHDETMEKINLMFGEEMMERYERTND
jgi:hypothetical protein